MALDFGKLNFSTSFNPTSAFPIDARSYFESLTAAQAAAATAEAAGSSNTTYYFGQILTVNEGGAVAAYQITNAKALQKLASTTSSGDLAGDVATLQSKVGALETAVSTTIPATYETKVNVSAIGERVTTAEGEIDTLQADVEAVEGNVSTLQTTVGQHTTSISGLQTNVGTLQTTVGNAESGLVKDVNDLKGQIGSVTGALHFKGVVAELPVDLSTYNEGDVILVGNKEYVCNDEDGTKSWVELGDEGSYALKTTTINGQPLSANITLGAGDVGADPAGTAASLVAGLDVAEVAVNANETVSTISETDGKIAVAKQAIQITTSQVTGLDTALAGKADASAVTAVEGNVTALQNSMANAEANIAAIQGAGYQTAANVNSLIANATIEAGKINGAVANAQYATQAGALINSITLNVAGTEHQFNGGEAVSIDITAAGLGALTSVPAATNEALGGIKVGFTSAGTNYAVELDANNAAFVNVPVPEVATYNGVGAISITANGANFDVAVAANGILTSMIADGAITAAKIAANAVTSDKIASVSTDAFVQGAQELILNGGTSEGAGE